MRDGATQSGAIIAGLFRADLAVADGGRDETWHGMGGK
jgi:hypothetical protein